MTHPPTQWLIASGALEIVASCLVGFAMLLPMQPWAGGLKKVWPPTRSLLSVHLDLIMMGFMQIGAGLAMTAIPLPHARLLSALLIFSAWMNPAPYAWRIVGIDAFTVAGGPLQVIASLLSLASTLVLTSVWLWLFASWV